MRKIVKRADTQSGAEKATWLDVGAIAQVEVTSEDPQYPIESAFAEGTTGGWRASEQGKQTIRLFFDEPQQIRRIWLQFVEVRRNGLSSSPCNGPRIRPTPFDHCFSNNGISVPAARPARSKTTSSTRWRLDASTRY